MMTCFSLLTGARFFTLSATRYPRVAPGLSKGLAVINLLSIAEGERVTAMVDTTGFAPKVPIW